MDNNSTLIATAVAGAVGLVGAFYLYVGSSNNDDLEPALTLSDTHSMLSEFLDKAKYVALQLSRNGQKVKQQFQMQGQEISDAEIMNFILPQFEKSLDESMSLILEEHDVSQIEIQEATDYYGGKGDVKINEIIEKIRRMHTEFGGSIGDDSSSGESLAVVKENKSYTFDTILEILEALSARVGNATESYVVAFKKEYGLPNTPILLEKFQTGMMGMSEEMEESILQSYDISPLEFQEALMSHQNNPALQQRIYMMQASNQQRLAKHGIQFG